MNTKDRQALLKAIEALDDMDEPDDQEAAHEEAEGILCTLLTEVGLGAAVSAFEGARGRVGFWYA